MQSSAEAARDQLTLGGILRAFLPLLLHLLKLGAHKLRVLWQLAACGTPALGANLFHPLPVNDAGQDQVQAAAGIHLLPQLAGVNPAPPPVKDISGQGVGCSTLRRPRRIRRRSSGSERYRRNSIP